jgi:hypothetical protein
MTASSHQLTEIVTSFAEIADQVAKTSPSGESGSTEAIRQAMDLASQATRLFDEATTRADTLYAQAVRDLREGVSRYTTFDVAAVIAMRPLAELIASSETVLAKLDDLQRSIPSLTEHADFKRQIEEFQRIQAQALLKWNRMANEWPWRDDARILTSRSYFEEGGEGLCVGDILNGLSG